MILYNNIVKISKNRWIGYMLKVAFLLASSIFEQAVDHNSRRLHKIKSDLSRTQKRQKIGKDNTFVSMRKHIYFIFVLFKPKTNPPAYA